MIVIQTLTNHLFCARSCPGHGGRRDICIRYSPYRQGAPSLVGETERETNNTEPCGNQEPFYQAEKLVNNTHYLYAKWNHNQELYLHPGTKEAAQRWVTICFQASPEVFFQLFSLVLPTATSIQSLKKKWRNTKIIKIGKCCKIMGWGCMEKNGSGSFVCCDLLVAESSLSLSICSMGFIRAFLYSFKKIGDPLTYLQSWFINLNCKRTDRRNYTMEAWLLP